MCKKLYAVLLSMLLTITVFPQNVYADEEAGDTDIVTETVTTETDEETGEADPAEDPEEIPAEEGTEEVIQEATPEPETEVTIPEITAEPVIEETEDPEEIPAEEGTEEVIQEATPEPETEVPVPEITAEPVKEETEEPEVTEEPVTEEPDPEITEEPVIEEEIVPEEPVKEEAPAEEKKEEQKEVIEETVTEGNEQFDDNDEEFEVEFEEDSNKRTITYDANGGKFPDGTVEKTDEVYYHDDEFYDANGLNNFNPYSLSVSVPYKDGYAFYGWYTTKETKASTRVGKKVSTERDMTLYAGYKPCYTVTLNVNGIGYLYGTGQDETAVKNATTATYSIVKGYSVSSVANQYRVNQPKGYRFTGWYLDKNCTPGQEADGYIPTGNVTLYACWEKTDSIKVVWHGNGGEFDSSTTYTQKYSIYSTINWVPDFRYNGKVLEGWYSDKALTQKIPDIYAFSPGSANNTGDPVHLYAKWDSPIKVTLDANGGRLTGIKKYTFSVAKGQSWKYKEIPDRYGYVFDGWYIDKDFTKKIDICKYPFTSSMTLYAKWIPAVKVTFLGNGKLKFFNIDDSDLGDEYGEEYACTLTSANYMIAKGYTFLESFQAYELQQLDYRDYFYQQYTYPRFITIKGYTFVGWYKDSALTKPFSFEKDKITSDLTLYPKVAETSSLKKYTVTLDPNGGLFNYGYTDHFEFLKGEYFTFDENWVAAPAGKKYVGLTTVKNDESTLINRSKMTNIYNSETEYKVTSNITLYAYYVPEYTVYLEGNGGYFPDRNNNNIVYTLRLSVGKGETITDIYPVSEDRAGTVLTTASGKIFLGWYSDKACTKLVTRRLDQYPIKKNQTLYAKWGAPLKAGWKKTDGQWWYKCQDGSYYNEGLQKIGSKYYFFQKSGYIKTGWIKIGSNWYYFNTGGDAAIGWKKVGSAWYYFASNGVMRTGWQKISGKWYYLKSSGAMAVGWLKISGKWYYFKSSGAMVTGWQKISGKWYHFTSSGVMKTGWLKLSGKWYYLDSSGAMATGSRVISGKTYNFNSSGVCLNP